PSLAFTLELDKTFGNLREISWNRYFGLPPKSAVKGKSGTLLDPNDYRNSDTLAQWYPYSDFLRFKGIVQFDSFDDLQSKLASTDLAGVRRAMKEEFRRVKEQVTDCWSGILEKVSQASSP